MLWEAKRGLSACRFAFLLLLVEEHLNQVGCRYVLHRIPSPFPCRTNCIAGSRRKQIQDIMHEFPAEESGSSNPGCTESSEQLQTFQTRRSREPHPANFRLPSPATDKMQPWKGQWPPRHLQDNTQSAVSDQLLAERYRGDIDYAAKKGPLLLQFDLGEAGRSTEGRKHLAKISNS